MMATITLEEFDMAKELLEKHAVPWSFYMFFTSSVAPVPMNDKWMMWLFCNEEFYKYRED